METKELQAYFKAQFYQTKGQAAGKEDRKFITMAIKFGKKDFHGAYPWAFREKHGEITTTGSRSWVTLPDDLDGILSIREKTTSRGRKLTKYAPDEYDRLFPASETMSTDTPKVYKIYYDDEVNEWRLDMYPAPSAAITLYVDYQTLEQGGTIPDKYVGGLKIAIERFMIPLGNINAWNLATIAFNAEIERLKVVDDIDVEGISKKQDSSDMPIPYSFSEYMRTGI